MLIRVRPSNYLAIILSFVHGLMFFISYHLTLPLPIKLLLVCAILVSYVYYLRRYALLTTSNAITAFELSEEKQCRLRTYSGETIHCVVESNSFIAPTLVILNLKNKLKRSFYSIVLLPDCMEKNEFRRLRVWLKWKH